MRSSEFGSTLIFFAAGGDSYESTTTYEKDQREPLVNILDGCPLRQHQTSHLSG